MKLLHTGDLHLTEGPRFQDTVDALDALVADGAEQGVHLWLVGGDLHGTTVPHRATPAERNVLAGIFMAMAEHAPVVIVYGNHDAPWDLWVYSRLRGKHPIYVMDRPEAIDVQTRDGNALVFGLPYPQKGWLTGRTEERAIEAQNAMGADALRTILESWRIARSHQPETPAILLAHINIGGSRVAGGEILIGREIELAPGDLEDLGVDYAGLSHIHLHQQMAGNAWYAGSPTAQNHGEQDLKGWLIVDVEAGKAPRVERRSSPARTLTTIRVRYFEDEGRLMHRIVGGNLSNVPGAEVRIVAEIPEEHAATVDVQAWADTFLRRDGQPHSVTIERRIIPTVRVRSEAITEARTTEQKLAAFWDSLGAGAPSAAQRAGAVERLGDLERAQGCT